jgi:hypothetical protein
MIALAALGIFWFACRLFSSRDRNIDDPFLWWPLVLAGLTVVAGYGLMRGGLWGRVLAVLVAIAGAALVVAASLVVVLWAATDPHGTTFSLTSEGAYGLPTWFFIVLVATVVAGYDLVLVRAIRGR